MHNGLYTTAFPLVTLVRRAFTGNVLADDALLVLQGTLDLALHKRALLQHQKVLGANLLCVREATLALSFDLELVSARGLVTRRSTATQ